MWNRSSTHCADRQVGAQRGRGRVRVGGNVNDTPATLPNALSIRIGKPVEFNRSQLDTYLAFKGIAARDIGGALDGPVSTTPGGKKALSLKGEPRAGIVE